MDILKNKYLIENFSHIILVFLMSFLITFLLVPWIGRLAKYIGAFDLPQRFRNSSERGFVTRIHDYVYPKLGGLAMVSGILITLTITGNLHVITRGVIVGIIIISIGGFIDDKFEPNSKIQLLFQLVAAAAVVISGITITTINISGLNISFNWLSGSIHILQYIYHFVFPADLITVLWIVGMINVINWVGGVDALNGSVTSIALLTLLILSLSSGNIPLAVLISIHLGGVLGVLPYNYNPGKIMYGSIGDFLNGFLLAIFAIIGSTKWTATLVVLAMPILDGLLVIYLRFKSNTDLLKHPLKILQVSDRNHLHHRLLDAGYSKKAVVLVEITLMSTISLIVLVFSNLKTDYLALILGLVVILVVFTLTFVLKRRNERLRRIRLLRSNEEEEEIPNIPQDELVRVISKQDKDKEEENKFIY